MLYRNQFKDIKKEKTSCIRDRKNSTFAHLFKILFECYV